MTDKEALQAIIDLYASYKEKFGYAPRYSEAIAHIGVRLGEYHEKCTCEIIKELTDESRKLQMQVIINDALSRI